MWFVNFAIENNHKRLVNHKDYLSPVCFRI